MKKTMYFASCKKHPDIIDHVFLPHSYIYSICRGCGTNTSTGVRTGKWEEHYDMYQTVLTKERGESYDAYFDRCLATVTADREAYRVTEYTDPVADARMKRQLTKRAKNEELCIELYSTKKG